MRWNDGTMTSHNKELLDIDRELCISRSVDTVSMFDTVAAPAVDKRSIKWPDQCY